MKLMRIVMINRTCFAKHTETTEHKVLIEAWSRWEVSAAIGKESLTADPKPSASDESLPTETLSAVGSPEGLFGNSSKLGLFERLVRNDFHINLSVRWFQSFTSLWQKKLTADKVTSFTSIPRRYGKLFFFGVVKVSINNEPLRFTNYFHACFAFHSIRFSIVLVVIKVSSTAHFFFTDMWIFPASSD